MDRFLAIGKPSRIGDFRVLGNLGEGADGIVLRGCSEIDASREVAIKLLPVLPETPLETRARFEHEARTLATLAHPNVVSLLDYGVAERYHYLVTELAPGDSLKRALLKHGALDHLVAADLLHQLALGLAHAHNKRVLHGDVKPSNIIVAADLSSARLIDFGLSHVLDRWRGASSGNTSAGTLMYMSPEQLLPGGSRADERSDLYSLGIVAIEMLSGAHPFAGQGLRELLASHASVVPELPDRLPFVLRRIVEGMVAKNPAARYRSARGLAFDLERYVQRARGGDVGAFELRSDDVAPMLAPPAFLGRDEERAALDAAYERARESVQLLAVAAPSGYGKTRLLSEAARAWTHSVVVCGAGRAYGQTATYGVIADALRMLPQAHLSMAQLREIQAAVGTLGAELGQLVPELRELLGEYTQEVPIEPEREQLRFFGAIGALFSAVGERAAPLVLIFDDLQWADDCSLEFIRWFARNARGELLMLLAYRNDEVGADSGTAALLRELRGDDGGLAQLTLAPLPDDQVAELIATMAGAVAPAIAARVAAQAEGSPLYAVELVSVLSEQGLLDGELGAADPEHTTDPEREARVADVLASVGISGTLAATIVARIDRLTPAQAQVLSAAAVVGSSFDAELVRRAVEAESGAGPEHAARETIAALAAAEQLHLIASARAAGSFAFSHDKIREALYARLDDTRRARLHGHIGAAIEARDDAIEARVYPLAHHYRLSHDHARAIRYARAAGDLAQRHYGYREALVHYEFALGHSSPADDPDAVALHHELDEAIADMQLMIGQCDRCIVRYQALIDRPDAPGPDEAARLYRKIGRAWHDTGDMRRAGAALERAIGALGVQVPSGAVSLAWWIAREAAIQIGHTLRPPRKHPRADDRTREVIRLISMATLVSYKVDAWRTMAYHLRHMNLAERYGLEDELAKVYSDHGPVCCIIPWTARAIDYGQRSLALRQKLGDRWGVAQSRSYLSHSLICAGRRVEAEEQSLLARQELAQIGDRWELATALSFRALNLVLLARWADIEEYLHEARRAYAETGNWLTRDMVTNESYGEIPSGDQESLLEAIEQTQSDYSHNPDPLHAVRLGNIKGKVLLRLGRYEDAEATLAQSKRRMAEYRLRADYLIEGYALHAEAILCRAEGLADSPQRRVLLRRAAASLREARWQTTGFVNHAAALLRMRARYAWARGARRRGERLWLRALARAAQTSEPYQTALCYLDKGLAMHRIDPVLGANLLNIAHRQLSALDARCDLQRLEALVPQILLGAPPGVADASKSSTLNASSRAALQPMPHLMVAAERLRALCESTERMARVGSLDELLQAIVEAAARLLRAKRAELFLYDEAEANFEGRARCSISNDVGRPVSSTILANVLRERRGVLIADAQAEPSLARARSVASSGAHSVVCTPLLFDGHLLGVLYLDSRLLSGLFTQDDLDLLEAFASQAAVALQGKAVETRLRHSEQRLSQIVDAASETYWDCDLASGAVEITPRWYEEMGYGPDEERQVSSWFQGLFDPEDELRLRAALRECAHGVADRVDEELRVRRQNGSDAWFHARGKIVPRDAADAPLRMLGTLQEITARKREQAQREASLKRLHAVVELDRAILQADPVEQIASLALRHAIDLVGCEFACALQFDFDAVLAHVLAATGTRAAGAYAAGATPALADLPQADLDMLARDKARVVDDLATAPPGAALVEEMRQLGMRSYQVLPLRAHRRLLGALVLASREPGRHDDQAIVVGWSIANALSIALQQASMRRRIEQQTGELEQRVAQRTAELEAANRELEGFSYTVSHDLRAPLRNMDELARLALTELGDAAPGSAPRMLQTIRTSARKMNRLIDDVLAFSKTGNQPLQRQLVDLNVVLREAIELCTDPASERRRIEWLLRPLPTVPGDPALLRIVLFNLLSNALKFTRERALAVIRVEAEDDATGRVQVRVVDNGAGFDPARRDKLFGVFQRLHSEREFEGTGIGLATVRRIVERHGGTVDAEGELGHGATFIVALPVLQPALFAP